MKGNVVSSGSHQFPPNGPNQTGNTTSTHEVVDSWDPNFIVADHADWIESGSILSLPSISRTMEKRSRIRSRLPFTWTPNWRLRKRRSKWWNLVRWKSGNPKSSLRGRATPRSNLTWKGLNCLLQRWTKRAVFSRLNSGVR